MTQEAYNAFAVLLRDEGAPLYRIREELIARGARGEVLNAAHALACARPEPRQPEDVELSKHRTRGQLLQALALGATGLAMLCLVCVAGVWSHPAAFVALALSSAVAGLALWAHRRRERRAEVLGNLVAEVGPMALVEFSDVQLAALVPTQPVRRGQPFVMTLRLQSCVNQPRRVTVRLVSDGPTGTQTGWQGPSTLHGVIGPGEVVSVAVTLVASVLAQPWLKLWLEPVAFGRMGRRVRYWGARPYQSRVKDTTSIGLALATGVIVVGGGYGARVNLTDEPPLEAPNEPLPEPEWHVTSTPTSDELELASRL